MTTSGSSSAPTTGGDTGGGQPRRAAVVGLTGGIASGKSTAARILGELGAHVIDADRLGHRAYEPDTDAFRAVVEAFGADVVGADGRIDRKALGGKVFGDPTALTRLTDIVWPEILRLARLEIAQVRAKSPDKIVILEAAVLLEAGWQEAMATARDGASAEAIQKRIDAQLSNQERIKRADVVILNDGSEQALRDKVETAWRRLND